MRKRVTFFKSIKIQAFITTRASFDQNIEAAVNKGKTGSIKKRDFKIISEGGNAIVSISFSMH